MEKTKNVGLNVTTDADASTQSFKDWRDGLDGNKPGSNMVIIDDKLGDAVYTANEEIAGEISGGYAKIYDQVIRTQEEFEALIASPTWLGAVSVCFIGDGGTLKFTRDDGEPCKIPQSVKQIQGINNAIIEAKNLKTRLGSNLGALMYTQVPSSPDYWINGISSVATVTDENAGSATSSGFFNCINLTNCSGSCTGIRASAGFQYCKNLHNCTGNGIGDYGSYGFYNCENLVNCFFDVGDYVTTIQTCIGFGYCYNLTNCRNQKLGAGTVTEGVCTIFYQCSNLSNCIADIINISGPAIWDRIYGYRRCFNIVASSAEAYSGRSRAVGFFECQLISSCGTAVETNPAFPDSKAWGIYSCKYINGCRDSLYSSTATFLGGTNTMVDMSTVQQNEPVV